MTTKLAWQDDLFTPNTRKSIVLNGKTVVAVHLGVWFVYVEGSTDSPTLAGDGEIDAAARKLAPELPFVA